MLKKEDMLEALERAMNHYESHTKDSESYWEGVVDGLNKAYRYIDSDGDYDLTA